MKTYNALSIINEFPQTKEGIKNYVRIAKNEMLSGYYNPLEIDLRFKAIEEVIKAFRSDDEIKELVVKEAEKYPEKTVNVYGCEITKKNHSTFNYTYCNDSVLAELQAKADEANKLLKERQEMLKHIKPGEVVNPETGEAIQPPLISTKTVLAVRLL